jgi:hypothetical protein
MTKYLWRLLSKNDWPIARVDGADDSGRSYTSVVWKSSNVIRGAKYAVRRISLGRRIELVQRTRALTLQNEFLRAGDAPDQMAAALTELYAQRLYLEWGFVEMAGFTIDGDAPTAALLVDCGPEALCQEIVEAIQSEMSLSDDERKNS